MPFVRHVCGHVLAELSVTADCQAAVLLAFTEACDNVILHTTAEDEYEANIDISADECEIRVVDAGHGLDASLLGAPFTMQPTTTRAVAASCSMTALVDQIQFESRPESGTIVHLAKQFEFKGPSPLARRGS